MEISSFFPAEKFGYEIIVMHLYDGTLKQIIHELNLKEKINAICQISEGLKTLHSLMIAHCDIHLDNIFYDKIKNRYDLSDFGFVVKGESNEFYEGKKLDLFLLKKTIESILIGEELNPINSINNIEDIKKLGFSSRSALLIMNYVNNTCNSAQETYEIFQKVKSFFL